MGEAQPPLRPNTLCSTITKAGSWSWTNAMLTCVLDYVREGGEFELKHWWLAALSVNEFEEGEGSGRILEAEVHLETIWRWKDRSEAQLLAIKDRNTLPKEGRQHSLAIKVLWTIKTEQQFSSLDDFFLMYKRHALSMQELVQLLRGGLSLVECAFRVKGSQISKSTAISFSICPVSHASFIISFTKALLLGRL